MIQKLIVINIPNSNHVKFIPFDTYAILKTITDKPLAEQVSKNLKMCTQIWNQKEKVNYQERFKSRRVFDSWDLRKMKSDINVVKAKGRKKKS